MPASESTESVVCPCTGATESTIKAEIKRCGGSLERVKKETAIATHCTGCLPAVLEIYDDVVQRSDLKEVNRSASSFFDFLRPARLKRALKRFTNIQRYALFVVNTPLAKSRVACSNLSIDEKGQNRGRVFFWGRLYNRDGKCVRRFFFTLKRNESKSIDIAGLLEGTPEASQPFYGLIQFVMRGSAIVGSTRPYGFWMTSDAVSSTHDKYNHRKDPGWQHTLVFVEISEDYDTDLVLCNPLDLPYSTRVWLLNDAGERFDLGTVEIPPHGSTMVCPLAINAKSVEFLAGRRGSLLLENEQNPVMSYYLGHDFKNNRWLIQHL